jgi:hypothetical protein
MKGLLTRFSTVAELTGFLWQMKLWWMIPMVFLLLMFGGLVVFAQSSAIAPFIYTLF